MKQTTASLISKEEQDLLWQRIACFPLDAPGAQFPFSRRLARENKWDYHFGQQAIEEYRKFIFLCCISPQGASPSKVVDKVWHLHLIYTQNYWEEFCAKTLQRNIHHHPSAGGSQEKEKHENWQADTLDLYHHTFHIKAPAAFWDDRHFPSPGRFRFLLRFLKRIRRVPLLLLPLILAACNDSSAGFIPTIVIIVIALGWILTRSQGTGKERKQDEGGGSGCSSSCSSGCGSGCGGGCGGCGS